MESPGPPNLLMAYEARVVVAWLSDYLSPLLQRLPEKDLEISKICVCVRLCCSLHVLHDLARYSEWFNMTERNGRFLTVETSRRMMSVSDHSIRAYMELGAMAVAKKRLLRPARPKIHAPSRESCPKILHAGMDGASLLPGGG